jgi:tetratricopeptide (TPR) repeat protein
MIGGVVLRVGALLERLARYHWVGGDTVAAMATVERAVATVPAEPPSAERARVLAAHGQMLMLWSRLRAASARCEEAVAVARQVGARAVEGHALNSLGTAVGCLGHLEVVIAHLEQARGIAAELGDPDDLCRALHNLGCVFHRNGRYEEAVRVELETLELAGRFGSMRWYGAAAAATAAEALLWLGRLEEAERLLDEVLDLDLSPTVTRNPLLSRGLQRLWLGDLEGARADLTLILERSRHRSIRRTARPPERGWWPWRPGRAAWRRRALPPPRGWPCWTRSTSPTS